MKSLADVARLLEPLLQEQIRLWDEGKNSRQVQILELPLGSKIALVWLDSKLAVQYLHGEYDNQPIPMSTLKEMADYAIVADIMLKKRDLANYEWPGGWEIRYGDDATYSKLAGGNLALTAEYAESEHGYRLFVPGNDEAQLWVRVIVKRGE